MLLFLNLAHALTAKVCVSTVTDFADADVSSTQDYLAGNASRPLRGTKVQLRHNSTLVIQTERTDTTGADKGCAEFTVMSGHSYSVRVWADVDVGGGVLTVRDPNDDVWLEVVDSNKAFAPGLTGAYYTLATSDVWNIVALGSYALHRENLGGAALTTFYTQDSSGNWNSPCGGTCLQGEKVWFTPAKATEQFAITYAMGWTHLEALGGVSFDDTMDEPDYNGGTSVHLLSPEDLSAAHAAGFAHLYSAVVFNDIEADCGMVYWRDADWDTLGTPTGEGSCFKEIETPAYAPFSCATGRKWVSPAANQAAYYQHMSLTTTFETSVDVLRFWWDAMSSYSLSFDQVVDAVDASNPSTWTTSGVTYESHLVGAAPLLDQAWFDTLSARHGID